MNEPAGKTRKVVRACRVDLERDLTSTRAENTLLKEIAAHLHWMARRYADGRQSYATSLHNDNTRELLAMGVALNASGDGTLWARDMGGRAYDGLTDEEAALGREPDWRHDDKERRIETLEATVKDCREVVGLVERDGCLGFSAPQHVCDAVRDLRQRLGDEP